MMTIRFSWAGSPSIPSPQHALSGKFFAKQQGIHFLWCLRNDHTLQQLQGTHINYLTVFMQQRSRHTLVRSSIRLQSRCQSGLGLHLDAHWGRVCSQAHSGCWQNSVLCSSKTHGNSFQSQQREQDSKASLLSRQESYKAQHNHKRNIQSLLPYKITLSWE